jgi:hypothetical protein
MKVAELITMLQTLDQNAAIYILGNDSELFYIDAVSQQNGIFPEVENTAWIAFDYDKQV